MQPSAVFAFASAVFVVVWVCWALYRALRDVGRSANAPVTAFGIVWLALPSAAAGSGFLANFESTPPRMMLVLPAVLGASLVFAFSPWGAALRDRFSLASLIGFQSFRFLPETLLAMAYGEGMAPVQMTWEGRNWDIATALLALAVFLLWRNASGGVPRWAAIGWSVIGLGLLTNIVAIAVLSMPTEFRVFHNEPANTFVALFPYILLPAVHVAAALGGHWIVLRKLAQRG